MITDEAVAQRRGEPDAMASAEVLVDGKAVGTAPLASEVFVEPGAHTIEARLSRRGPAQRDV
jgi:hypothetical protein